MTEPRLDLARLLRLRLVVARFGEMDHARWWNTKGQLGRYGAAALAVVSRARTSSLRRAPCSPSRPTAAPRSSSRRSRHALATPPEAIEEEFDARWEHWLDHAEPMDATSSRSSSRSRATTSSRPCAASSLVSDADADAFGRPRAARRRVERWRCPRLFSRHDDDVALSRSAFARGEPERSLSRTRESSDGMRPRRLAPTSSRPSPREGCDDRRDLRGVRGVGLRAVASGRTSTGSARRTSSAPGQRRSRGSATSPRS